MPRPASLTLCSPHVGLEPHSDSGGAVYEREILSGLARLGVRIHLPMPRGQVVPEILAPGVEPRWPPHGWRWWLAPFFVAPAVRRCWRRHRFRLLRAHAPRFVGPGCLGARPAEVPLVAHHHHLDGIWQERVDLAVLRRARLVTTDSEWSRARLAEHGIPSEVVSPGVGQEFFTAPRDRTGRRLLFLGGLKPRKNPLVLPQILARLRDLKMDASLDIVGGGPLRDRVDLLARHLGVRGHLRLLGRVPDECRPALYAQADVFVFPSLLEGFGMPVLEAMAAGLPVVASARGAIPELVQDGRTGFLVKDPEDVEGFAERIALLLGSPTLRDEMGGRARAEASGCLWGRSASRLDRLYRGLL